MTKIDIISGFLGAGKTSFIQKLLAEALKTEKVVLIENEFGEIGIDGGFLKDAGIEIREMNQGCICCSLVGDFESSLREVVERYQPERILIEPSGVGKLSDIIGAVKSVSGKLDVELHAAVTVVDAKKAKLYSRNFGEFFNNQIKYAGTVVLSRTDIADGEKIDEAAEIVRAINPKATVITTPVQELGGAQLLEILSKPDTMEEEMLREVMERVHAHEHHHHEDAEHDGHEHHGDAEHAHGEHCGCGCHDTEHGKHHHEDAEHAHHHHAGHGGHEHHHHHDADEIFMSWSVETARPYDRAWLSDVLDRMANTEEFGTVVRAKGMLKTQEGPWMYFDLVPEQTEIREGSPDYTGRLVVIGASLREDALNALFKG